MRKYSNEEIVSIYEEYINSAKLFFCEGDPETPEEYALRKMREKFKNFDQILAESRGMNIPDPEEDQTVVAPEKKEEPKAETVIETKVETKPDDQQSDMSQGRQPVINLGTGVVFDPNKINQEIAHEIDPSNPARVMLQQNQEQYAQQQMMQPIQQAPMMPSMPQQMPPQFDMNPMMQRSICQCGDPNCPGSHNGDIVIPMGDKIRVLHRIDEPAKKKAVPNVAKPDNVDVNLKGVDMTDGMIAPKPAKGSYDIIQPLPEGEPIDQALEKNAVDNSPLIAKIDKVPLQVIEKIANQNGHSVAFYEYPNEGIICVVTYGSDGKAVYPKSFCIDTGKIIDARVKLNTNCPILPNVSPENIVIEYGKFYELFVIDPKSHKKVLDEQLLNDMFSAGYLNIKKRSMYSDEYIALNRKLALITIPTKGLNKEQRNAVQSFLIENLDKTGYLDLAIEKTPGGCRFAFLDDVLNKNDLANFTLVNEGVPMFYGAEKPKVVPTVIKVTNGIVSVKANGEEVQLAKK